MIRVVIDTNIFISSFFGGNPRKIIDLWKSGQIILCLSHPIIDEYVDVLRRMGLQNERELEELLSLFAQGFHVLFTNKTPNLNIVEKDPDDDKFIECAVSLNSKFIISGDKALQEIKDYMGIKIQGPKQFLDDFAKKKR
ncbi:MAG: putative toxin-antitoxin system toxin component, PIN family [Deltaproteobacteria bacterium]|nr:putative toxin-antitoxin system toxin component, PIN family [Deltaproteobacteria bacterium]